MDTVSSSSKKRKISHDDDDDDDDEEEQIEKFYALIKSIRETRGRLILNKEGADHQSKTKKQKFEEKKQVLVWKPSFQREDFMEEADWQKKPPVTSFTSTCSQIQEGTESDQKEEVKEEIDLSLSL